MLTKMTSRSLYAAVLTASLWFGAASTALAQSAQPAECRAADFATAVDRSGATLRAFTLEAQPKLQERMRRYSEAQKLESADYEASAIDAIQDDKLTALDDKSANMLLRIDSLGRVPEGAAPDCSKLAEISTLSRELLGVMKEKSDYMLARLDAKISEAGGAPKQLPTPPAEKPVEADKPAAPEKPEPSKSATAKTETPKPKPKPEAPIAKSATNDAYVPPTGAPEGVVETPPVVVQQADDGYTIDEVREATRGFFGTVSTSLASVLEHAFKTT
nr:DUF1134 domain-containing protein [Hyphomicrobium sp.]